MSCSSNAVAPDRIPSASAIACSSTRVPVSRVLANPVSSDRALLRIRGKFSSNSGYASTMASLLAVNSFSKLSSVTPSNLRALMDLRKSLRSTYPRPSLDAVTPSDISISDDLMWSAMTRIRTSSISRCPYFFPLS